jgi:predicted transcriptional regulator
MKYRSRTEIVSAMLRIANRGATKTRIMYGAYLSYAQVMEYLRYLQENELVKYEAGRGLYTLTSKGMEFLRACDKLEELAGLGSERSEAYLAVEESPKQPLK